ncbi:MAG: hypothetical protein A3H57_00060 [Candidatus Taylorbacteria bacterium RIFCSPLOWO2_02_FULL_43_11]|uniref:General secretion pathway GspH domain-containing protein n=1 Tax=Candidatus Taylorbacteria bacterium RIFCSPHIGHO2_02_FULL_43_32b TaxID=1802306 RepID=A0A1G2MIS1_9BACT|nr:MAG: hypothetical protein A2743_01890 [Candidatus Taylorbacteria bacterium RIFCSPHIGHO2_01_FULL_43_47]OHA23830.1 MAG: hypothetical protein A3C72_01355 [Candidatus Taylorbacteria bacterium RIFCSPHIGHO2_02_FULL_43_32b]OHA37459.1 MAG: hypothetical protein A3H57_00060 [Candidatus Taylorbacteria bacterium RIFCSPLOWO2_02_FULL_43_11]
MIFYSDRRSKVLSGLTLVEVLVVMAISTFILAGSMGTYVFFNNIRNTEALNKAANTVKFRLEEARSLTISSKDSSVYGVHLEATQVVLFKGDTYVAGAASNQVSALGAYAIISSINLSPSGSDIVFERLTGEASRTGTIVAAQVSDATKIKTITISKTGFASLVSP